jgi:hypothetical protein
MVERKVVESFVGTVASLALAVPETAYYLRRLQDSLCRGSGVSPLLHGQRKRDRVRLTHGAVKDVAHWQRAVTGLTTRPIWPIACSPAATLHTDSSMSSWGATLSHDDWSAGTPALRRKLIAIMSEKNGLGKRAVHLGHWPSYSPFKIFMDGV